MEAELRTLVVAPTPAEAGDLVHVLLRAGMSVGARRVATQTELCVALHEGERDWDIVLCQPGESLDAEVVLALVRNADAEVPVVLVDADAIDDDAAGIVVVPPDAVPTDISQLLRRELALAEARRAARGAAATTLDVRDHALASVASGIVIADAAIEGFPTVYANPAFERLTGWPVQAMLGQSCALLQGEDTDPAAVERIREALRTGQETSVTLLNHRQDGSPFWNELDLAPVRDRDGRYTHVIGVLTDVTERVDTLHRLRDVERDNATLADDLVEAEARYRQLVERVPVVTYVSRWDEEGSLTYISPQVEALLGHPPQAFLDDPALWDSLLHPDDRLRVQVETERVYRDGEEFDCEYRVIAADGRERHLWERDTIVVDDEGNPLCTQGVVVDITSLRMTELALRDERDRAQRYLDVAGSMIVVIEPNEEIALLNRTGHELLGYEDGELDGCNWFDTCQGPAERERARALFHEIMAGRRKLSRGTYEDTVQTRDGRERIVSWHTTLLRDDQGRATAILSSGVDITERRQAEEQIAYLAYHDSLTGLPNRALLKEHLDLALGRARRTDRSVALLYLDLDEFKLVNDSFGHDAGDDLLRSVAMRLDGRRRASDLLVRQGGDEFLLLISDIDSDPLSVAKAAAEGMLSVLSDSFRIAGEQFFLGGSVGISIYPADAQDTDTLLRHADAAMYQAKAAGRSGIMPYETNHAEPLQRLSMTTRLRRAIAQDELTLDWQPIVAPDTGALYAVEALVRWEDPLRGRVPPGDFIPIAEETGLIERIGEWVLDEICRQRLAWEADGLFPAVTMNLSPRELRSGDLADRILGQLKDHGIDPTTMTIEVTESAAMREHERTEPVLRQLADGGLKIAIDDFGAGYSSLSRLRQLPVHVLKLDRTFVADVPERPDAAAVVAAVLELATALGMDAVIEGVETEIQRQFLIEHGCPYAQGFLLGRPVAAGALTRMLRQGREAAA